MDSIFDELDYWKNKYNIERLHLSDDVFSSKPDWIIDFCKRIKPYNLRWFIWLRLSDSLTLDILKKMKDAGCERIFYGLESADNRILKSMQKGVTTSIMEKVLSFTVDAGIEATGCFIFGDPEETTDSVNNTLMWIHRNFELMHIYYVAMIRCYPGSKIYNDAVTTGIINPIDYIIKGCPPVNISKLSDEDYSILTNDILAVEGAVNVYRELMIDIKLKSSIIENKYHADFSCPACGKPHSILITPSELSTQFEYPILSLENFICESCGNLAYYFQLPCYTKWIDNKLNNILEHDRCAIWPASPHFAAVYGVSKALRRHKHTYTLINKNRMFKGKLLLGKNVYLPSIISEGNIDTVIIFSRYYDEILSEIKKYYPYVKPILFHEIGYM